MGSGSVRKGEGKRKRKTVSDSMTQVRMLSIHASHSHYNPQLGHAFLRLWKESVENITRRCGLTIPGILLRSVLPVLNDKSKLCGCGWVCVWFQAQPSSWCQETRLPLGIFNSSESLALMVTIHNQSFRRGKTPKTPRSHSLNVTMRSFREKRVVQLFWVTSNVSQLETERMTQESTT